MAWNPLAILRQRFRAWMRQWLMGPEMVAEITAAAQRLHQLGAETDAKADTARRAVGLWVAVPGGRLELLLDKLSGCGFYIQMDLRPGKSLYQLYTPEGDRMAWGYDLRAMKRYGEQLAHERTEFDAAAGWHH